MYKMRATRYEQHIPETIVVQDKKKRDQATYKRQPIEHACDACRKEKIRCWLGESEPCLRCATQKLECVLPPLKEEDDHLKWLAELGVE